MEKYINQVNRYSRERTPFLLLADFELTKVKVIPLDQLGGQVLYDFDAQKRQPDTKAVLKLEAEDLSFKQYYHAFEKVRAELAYGNTFLINLTSKVQVQTALSLEEIYKRSVAKYKVYLKDEFVSFSPETFVQIEDGIISTYPMKGTINASIKNAKQILLEDTKELAEHYTVVDLLRNDLSIHAREVTVEQFRYIDKIKSQDKELLQASSKVTGRLPEDYINHLGDIIFSMLPAGSISGAPKKKTVQIIQEAEGIPRGYYTGICGVFDGKDFDSCVLIRYIEQDGEQKYYRAGGGITVQSEVEKEYLEILDKIYLPTG